MLPLLLPGFVGALVVASAGGGFLSLGVAGAQEASGIAGAAVATARAGLTPRRSLRGMARVTAEEPGGLWRTAGRSLNRLRCRS